MQLTMADLRELLDANNGDKSSPHIGGVKICVLHRGWVFVGRVSQTGSTLAIDDGAVIRKWGTTRGLGEIAAGGPTADTKLDPVPRVTVHELGVVAMIDCEASKWSLPCK